MPSEGGPSLESKKSRDSVKEKKKLLSNRESCKTQKKGSFPGIHRWIEFWMQKYEDPEGGN